MDGGKKALLYLITSTERFPVQTPLKVYIVHSSHARTSCYVTQACVAKLTLTVMAWSFSSWMRWPSLAVRHVLLGVFIGVSLSLSSTSFILWHQARRRERNAPHFSPRPIELRVDDVLNGVVGLIGNTPLIRIASLSDALGVEILGKAEVRLDARLHMYHI